MPQEPRFTITPPPTNKTSQSAEDGLDCLRNAQLEPSLNLDPIRANTNSRNQEHANRGAQHETGIRKEQLPAFGAVEEEAITTVQPARFDEASEARFRWVLQDERSERPATSSMEISDPSNDGTMSTEHTSTVTFRPSNTDRTSLPDPDRVEEVPGEDHISNLPPQANITLHHIFEPPTPPNIVEVALQIADSSDVTLTEEEYLSFKRQPFEAQQHTVQVYLRELAIGGLIL